MSEQQLRELKGLLPMSGGNRAFDRGVVEALEAAAKALAGLPAEALEPLRELTALAVAREKYHQEVMARLDTPDSRAEIEQTLADIRAGKIQLVPMEDIVREIEALEFGDRNGTHPKP